jgi:4,5-dihydroxyphthalate decarboxylase
VAAPLRLTLACADYEILRPLVEGRVVPQGVELVAMTDDHDRLYRLARRGECDIAEFNITEYFRAVEHGLDLTAIPVFPHRRFRHSYVFVDPRKAIASPADLIGRKVGVIGVAPAAGVWVRGILSEFHALPLDQVDWREDPLEPIGAGAGPPPRPVREKQAREKQVREKQVREKQVREELLLDGEVDALISPGVPAAFRRGDPRVARLFRDAERVELDYYRATGIFPIMHVVTIRRRLVERYPWLAESLGRAFQRSKLLGYERTARLRSVPLALIEHHVERERRLFGPDPWEYGLSEANRRNVATIERYTRQLGRTCRPLSFEELFTDVDASVWAMPSG